MKSRQVPIGPGDVFREHPETVPIGSGNEPVLIPERTGAVTEIAGDKVSIQKKIEAGLGVIANSWKLQPSKDVNVVVGILDEALGIAKADRTALVPFKKNLLDKAEIMLADDFADFDDPAQARENFAIYYGQIFDAFCGVQP
jgi:hypothetical protein